MNLPEAVPMPAARLPQAFLQGDLSARPRTLIAWALFDWLIIAGAWMAMARFEALWVQLAGTVVIASRLQAFGVILHDACHRARRQDSRAWWLVEMLAGWPIASTTEAMRYHHLRHHALSGTPMDPYGVAATARTWPRRQLLSLRGALLPFWWTLRAFVAPFALLFPRLQTFYGRAFLQDRSGRNLQGHAGVIACARADLVQVAAQVLVLGSAVAAGLPVWNFYILPWMLAGILNARRIIHEHAWTTPGTRSRQHAWETTLDHDSGPVGNAILYPHNVGLHRTHHLYPAVSFVHLRRLAAAMRVQRPAQT